MRHELYQGFYGTLKRFINDENFYINFGLPAEFFVYTGQDKSSFSKQVTYTLCFDKYNKLFYVKETLVDILPIQVYGIIKNYVLDMLAEDQKKAFNGKFDIESQETLKSYNFFIDEKDRELYCELVDMFKEFLWNEPISPLDVTRRGCLHRLAFGFSDVDVPIEFLCELLEVIHNYTEIFSTGIIETFMVDKFYICSSVKLLEYFMVFEKDGYATVSILAGAVNKVALTEKFYDAFKKAFYYDYDPRIARPSGCINF